MKPMNGIDETARLYTHNSRQTGDTSSSHFTWTEIDYTEKDR